MLNGPWALKFLVQGSLSSQDWALRAFAPLEALDDVVLLGLDEPSLRMIEEDPEVVNQHRSLQLMTLPFPWSREVWGLAAERLLEAGAKVVVLDFLYLDLGSGDDVLREVVERYPGQIVLGGMFEAQGMIQDQGSSYLMSLPSESVLPDSAMVENSVGYVNFWPDSDGVIRSTRFRMSLAEGNHGYSHPDLEVFPSLAAATCLAPEVDDAKVPQDRKYYRMPWVSGIEAKYRYQSVYEIFWPSLWERNYQKGEFFRDKVVFIGPMVAEMQDRHQTPLGNIPGPYVHLNAITALRQGSLYSEVPPSGNLLITLAMGILGTGLVASRSRPGWMVTGFLAGVGGYVGIWPLVLTWSGCVLDVMAPLSAFVGVIAFGFSVESFREWKEKLRLKRALEQRMPKEVVDEILQNPDTYYTRLGGRRQSVAILFSDVRGFTSLTESMEPDALVAQLNEYLEAMVQIIFARQGMVDKFIGDAIMAMWGNVKRMTPEEASRAACQAAREMCLKLEELNEKWRAQGRPELKQGIGVHYGEAVTGNIGSEQKMELTAIGDAVNLAARLESLTKQYGATIAISETVGNKLEERAHLRMLDRVQVVGKSESTTLYSISVHPPNERELEWNRLIDEAFSKFLARDFSEARLLFEKASHAVPSDGVLPKLIARCIAYEESPPPENWDGGETLKKK